MLRSAMTLLMILAFSFGFVVPATAVNPVNVSVDCSDMAEAGTPAPSKPPCCDFACAGSLIACASCVSIVATALPPSTIVDAPPLRFNTSMKSGQARLITPPDPPPPRWSIV